MPTPDETETDAVVDARLILCARIRAERKRLGLTVQAVADALGVVRQSYMAYERGTLPGMERLIELRAMGYDMDRLLSPLPLVV